jgi:hypothetical protein
VIQYPGFTNEKKNEVLKARPIDATGYFNRKKFLTLKTAIYLE